MQGTLYPHKQQQQQVSSREKAVLAALSFHPNKLKEWVAGAGLDGFFAIGETTTFREAFQYLSNLPLAERRVLAKGLKVTIPLVDYLAQLRSLEEDSKRRKKKGAVYTPLWLARHITANAHAQWKRLHRGGKKPASICDPSCGVGSFLFAAQEQFGDAIQVVGYDIDTVSLDYSRLLSMAIGCDWRLSSTDPLFCTSSRPSLFEGAPLLDESLDIIVGNPPYVRAQNLDKDYVLRLREKYPALTTGSFDLSILFLEHALRCLTPGGLFSYIVSSKFTSAKYGKEISAYLANQGRVVSIEDLGDEQIFPEVTTYTCIITVAKLAATKRFTLTRYPSGFSAKGKKTQVKQQYTLPYTRLLEHPWDFTQGHEQEVLSKLKNPRHPLILEVFREIVQGVRTGANTIYVLPKEKAQEMENNLLIPFVNGETIRRFRVDSEINQLIFPYKFTDFGEVVPLEESELQCFPVIYSYLLRHKAALKERARDTGTPWYAFSRSQNLSLPRLPKILVREMMPRSEFAADVKGEVIFSSGYALVPFNHSPEELTLWTAVLNTPVMEFALRQVSTQLHSGWFRLLKHYLGRLRLPCLDEKQHARALTIANQLAAQPAASELWSELNQLVGDAFELTTLDLETIDKYLLECHKRSLSERQKKESFPLAQGSGEEQAAQRQSRYEPVVLEQYTGLHRERFDLRKQVTFTPNKKRRIHRWYHLTQGYAAGLVEQLTEELGVKSGQTILDPFAGSGTTNVVCQELGINSIGVEISPLMAWVALAKTRQWSVQDLHNCLSMLTTSSLSSDSQNQLPFQRFLNKAFSKEILGQIISVANLAQAQANEDGRFFLQLGLISVLEEISFIRKHGSHYRYMNSSENIGLQKLNTQLISPTADIKPILIKRLNEILEDICTTQSSRQTAHCTIIEGDFLTHPLDVKQVDAVITSPPYLNRNNYLAQQKAELALLGLISDEASFRQLVRRTLRSHVESDLGQAPSTQFSEVRAILDRIEISPGNNAKIPHMIAGYFEDMNATLKKVAKLLKPGGRCAFVVGNSRWGGVVVPVDHLLLLIAEKHGFRPLKVLVTRHKGNSPQQMRKYGLIPVRESIVIFEKRSVE